jgi:RNA polymerase sigma factor (sigma-70 family)
MVRRPRLTRLCARDIIDLAAPRPSPASADADTRMPPRSAPLPALQLLFAPPDGVAREKAWSDFLAGCSDVLLRVARVMGGDQDAVMDRYAFILDALSRDDYRRLRAYVDDGRSSFDTWLAVVARRLCMDEYRGRYGRAQGDSETATARRAARRNLGDLVGGELGLDELHANADATPDAELERKEWRSALDTAIATLETEDRVILRLRFEDDLSVPEIARLLSLGSPFALYRRVNRILEGLRKTLEAAGIYDAET